MSKKIAALLTVFGLLVVPLQPPEAQAGWTDDGISKITTNVKSILETIADAKTTIADGKIKAMIAEIRQMLTAALAAQQDGLDGFLAGGCESGNLSSECGRFRADLVSVLQKLEDLNNNLLGFHSLPALDLQLEDPGLKNFVEVIPGRALYPLYKVLTKIQFFESGLIDALDDANANLVLLKSVVFENASQLDVCEIVNENSEVLTVAASSVLGIGIVSKIVGGIFEAFSKTVFSGPVEMDGGIHGYVHGTIKQNNHHLVGKVFTTFGAVLSSVSSVGFNKVKFCGIQQRQETILTNQTQMLANQAEILLGQRRMLCAFKHNLPDACAEFRGNGFGNRGKKLP